jgi:SAM-dependent methyltransferase
LELGAGSGGLTRYLTSCPFLVASDIHSAFLRKLHEPYHGCEGVQVCTLDLDQQSWAGLPEVPFDTVVASNVLEHIKDDERVLLNAHAVLQPGGRLILLVPAGPSLFGQIDVAIGHCRWYSQAELCHKLQAAGFDVVRCQHINFLGLDSDPRPLAFAAMNLLVVDADGTMVCELQP